MTGEPDLTLYITMTVTIGFISFEYLKYKVIVNLAICALVGPGMHCHDT